MRRLTISFDAIRSSIVSLARALTNGSADAEDLAQDVFVRVWRSLRGFRGDSTFRTWLHRIAVNVIHSHHGRVSRLRQIFPPAPKTADEPMDDPIERAPDPADLEADVVLRDAIDKALAALPDELRVAVTLRDVQGWTTRRSPACSACRLGPSSRGSSAAGRG